MKDKCYAFSWRFVLCCLFTFQTFAQADTKTRQNTSEPFKFDFIKDYRIKLDGGCSYYTYDTTLLERKKYIFIVSAKNVAFMNIRDKYVYLKRQNRKITGKNKYTDSFSGNGYQVVLTCTQISEIVNYSSIYSGTLAIKNKGTCMMLPLIRTDNLVC
jgi:hypothetical protein